MANFKCKMCGGIIEVGEKQTVATCDYCGTYQTLPRLDDERRANMYDRANHFRRNNEFDKASGIYEQILLEDNMDSEAYWSLVLCRFGVEYVADPASRQHVPTINRIQFTSVYDDENYKSAIKYSDTLQRTVYESEAKRINEIQKGMLAISQKEEPFDVFICYKETDRNGRRTKDSVLAQELYNELTREGYKVFFSRITLEDKLGSAYEPYIFAALNSAKVMVVVGTEPEHFKAIWVKNEWSRFLALIKNGAKKVLIPAYKDMDPYDLPEEFSHLQAQDMNKLGFMQDLTRGIEKIIQAYKPKVAVKETIIRENSSAVAAGNVESLLKRAFMFLEDGDWQKADEYCEKVLDIDPECARAYFGKMLAKLKLKTGSELVCFSGDFSKNSYYNKALRYADKSFAEQLQKYLNEQTLTKSNNAIYNAALDLMRKDTIEKYEEAIKEFSRPCLKGWLDSENQIEICKKNVERIKNQDYLQAKKQMESDYLQAKKQMESNHLSAYKAAIAIFKKLDGWKDSNEQIEICKKNILKIIEDKNEETYRTAIKYINFDTIPYYEKAIELFGEILDWKDSKEKIIFCKKNIDRRKAERSKKEEEERKREEAKRIEQAHQEAYLQACSDMNKKLYTSAIQGFEKLGSYKDSKEKLLYCQEMQKKKAEKDRVIDGIKLIINLIATIIELAGIIIPFIILATFLVSSFKQVDGLSNVVENSLLEYIAYLGFEIFFLIWYPIRYALSSLFDDDGFVSLVEYLFTEIGHIIKIILFGIMIVLSLIFINVPFPLRIIVALIRMLPSAIIFFVSFKVHRSLIKD